MKISKQTLSSKMAIAALLLLFVFLGEIKFKQWRNQRLIEKEKQGLEQQADDLGKKNKELSDSVQYLSSTAFKEKVAREQLGLKKQDELVYSFTNAQNNASQNQSTDKSNFRKWWDYFFAN